MTSTTSDNFTKTGPLGPNASPTSMVTVGLVALAAFVVTAAVVSLWPRLSDSSAGLPVAQGEVTPISDVETNPAADGLFIAAWARSAAESYAVTGTVYRIELPAAEATFGSPRTNLADAQAVVGYRHGQTTDWAMTQMGRTVTVIAADQGEKTCTPVDESYWCNPTAADDDVALTLAQQRDGEVRNVINQVSGPDASHRLYPLERVEVEMELDLSLVAAAAAEPTSTTGSDCWEARAVKGDHGHRWGRRAQFCFDRVTGALVFRRVFGESRIEVFVADTVVTAAELTIDDLNPR